LEVMANSNNVLRAGLTQKHVDVQALISCTSFIEKRSDTILAEPKESEGIREYVIPVEDFRFAIILNSEQRNVSVHSAEILLPLDCSMMLTHDNGESCIIDKGHSVFIPAYAHHYCIQCSGRVARVTN